MSNLDRVLDAAMELPLEQQEILVQILTNRIIESRRDEIASDAAASIAEFTDARLKVQTATEAIQELREYLKNPNESDLLFPPEQRVEVIILTEKNEIAEISKKVRDLFDKTQAIPRVQEITEEEIAAEIEAYRRGE